MSRLATLELHMTVIDNGKTRSRWNGDPMASAEATAALYEAVDAVQGVFRRRGLLVHTSYGVTAKETDHVAND